MKQFMDIFSLPEMTLLSCVNEHFLKNNIDYEPVHLYKDVKVGQRAGRGQPVTLWLPREGRLLSRGVNVCVCVFVWCVCVFLWYVCFCGVCIFVVCVFVWCVCICVVCVCICGVCICGV